MEQGSLSPSQQQVYILSKEQEKGLSFSIKQSLKQARSMFFTLTIKDTLKQAGATDEELSSIIQLFAQREDYNKCLTHIDLNQLGPLAKYQKQIHSLLDLSHSFQMKYQKQETECTPILDIIGLKYASLKVVRIEYHQRNEVIYNRYSVSAFDLFRAMHENKQLKQFSLKGIEVTNFSQCLKTISSIKKNTEEQVKEDQQWMKSFDPSYVELTLKVGFLFYLSSNFISFVDSQIDDLVLFGSLFQSISGIRIQITLGLWNNSNSWGNILKDLFKTIKKFKKISLAIQGEEPDYGQDPNSISESTVSTIGSILFGELSSFTDISSLSFEKIYFDSQISVDSLQQIGETLKTIFENNKVTQLSIKSLINFPVFPQIITLNEIDIWKATFRPNVSLMNELTKSNQSLRILKYQGVEQQQGWISEELLNRLQYLMVWNSKKISLNNIFSSAISNIRYLNINDTHNAWSENCLSTIFPKLDNLTFLHLQNISFANQILCLIPSTHLEELHILGNSLITQPGIKIIDEKWPSLRFMLLYGCQNITANVWSSLQLKGLTDLVISSQLLGEDKKLLPQLKRRGIKVYYL